jgi:serine/threonine-protein kinase
LRSFAGLTAMLLFTALAAALWLLPSAPTGLEALHRDLRAGRPAAVLDGLTRAPWWKWRLGEGGFTVPKGGGGLGIQSFDRAILEVLPDPHLSAYRLQVNVRHDQGSRLSGAGVAFGIRRAQSDTGWATSFWTVLFNDLEPQTPPLVTNAVSLRYWTVRESAHDGAVTAVHTDLTPPHRFEPSLAPLGEGPWRLLEATVTPDLVRIRWNGADAGEIKRTGFVNTMSALQRFRPDVGPIPDSFAPGGIGLFVDEGEAVFSGLVVEPLAVAPK